MNELELYRFIEDNNCEYHWHGDDVLLFINTWDIQEFNKLFSADFFDDDGLRCVMRKGYFCFEMKEICEYYDININNVCLRKNK